MKISNVIALSLPLKKRIVNDFYDGFEAKFFYYWPSIDLVYMSGIIPTFDLTLKKKTHLYNIINYYKPELLIVSSAFLRLKEEIKLLKKLKIPFILSNPTYFNIIDSFSDLDLFKGLLLYPDKDTILNLKNGKIPEFNFILNKHSRLKIKKPEFYLPDHNFFNNKQFFLPFFNDKFAVIATSIGCKRKCSFCTLSSLEFFERDITKVKNEIIYLYKNGYKYFYIQDPDLFLNKYWKEIINFFPEDSKISIQTNLSTIKLLKKDNIYKKIINIRTGIESGSCSILKDMKKPFNYKILKQNIRILNNHNVKTIGFFILGYPKENIIDYLKSIIISLKLKFDIITISDFTKDPGTKFFKNIKTIYNSRNSFKNIFKKILWYIFFYIAFPRKILNIGKMVFNKKFLDFLKIFF